MRALLHLAWIQNRLTLRWLSLSTVVLAWLLAAPLAPMRDGVLKMVAETPFLKKMLVGFMGLDLTGELTVKLLVGSTWGHPILLFSMWGFAVAGATRFPAQEIERESIDSLMAQPVSRSAVLLSQTVVVTVGLVILHIVALAGFVLGCLNLGTDAPALAEMVPVAVNLFILSLFVMSLATLASCLSSQRMKAAGALLWFGLLSLILGYLKPFLSMAKTLSWLGLLHYYRPGEIMNSGSLPWGHLGGLLLASLVCWGVAREVLVRRDLL